MAITLNLPPAVEQRLMERASQIGQSLEEYLQELVTREAERERPAPPKTEIAYAPEVSSREAWVKALHDWVARFPRVEHFVDDSRESIYAGRGE